MSEMIENIAKEVEELGKSHHAAIESLKSENTESFQKAADASADAMEKIQKLEAEKKETQDNLKALEKRIARGLSTGNQDAKDDPAMIDYYKAVEDQLRLGKQGKNRIDKEIYSKAFDSLSKRHHLRLKTVQESIDVDGGFYVHPEFLSQRVQRIFETSPIRQFANVIPTATNRVELVIDDADGTQSVWIGENIAVPASNTPQIGNLTIPVHKLKVQQPVTLEMIQDSSIDITQWIVDKTMAKHAREQNTAFMAGNGVGKPKGILDYAPWAVAGTYQTGKVEHIKSGVAGQFTYNSLTNMQSALKEDYQGDARWMIKRANWAEILQLKDTQDRPLYVLNNLLQQGASMVLLGKPVVFANDVNTIDGATPSTGNLIYGDFSGYSIVERMGITLFVDQFTQAAKDNVIYYITSRVGGALTSYESLKVLDASA